MPKSSFEDDLQNQDHNTSLYLLPVFVLAFQVVPSAAGRVLTARPQCGLTC